MTFNKIHNKRQLGLGGSTTTTASHAASTSTNGSGMTPPSGPPLVLTTTTSASASRTTTSAAASPSLTGSASGSTVSTPTSVSTVPTTPPAAANTGTSRTTPVANTAPRSTVTRVTTSASSTASAAANGDDSSGMSVGTMAGIAAAAIVGIAVVSAFIVWFMRRRNKNHDIDEEPFNRNSFMRHSTVIPDDDAPPPSRIRPPPTMSERGATPVYGAGPYSDMSHDGFGYNTQPSYVAQPTFNHPYGPGGAPATPLPFSPGYGTTYDQQQGFNNGGYADLTRGAPNHEYPPSPHGYDANAPSYVGHDNFPMPPPAAAGSPTKVHYPELTPATTMAQQGQIVSVNDTVHNGRETPVQLGFTPAPGAPQGMQGKAQPGQTPARGPRPESTYDTEDAYGGI